MHADMRIHALPLFAFGLLASVPSPGRAQQAQQLAPGARVRVWTLERQNEKQMATLVGLRGDTLLLQAEGKADTMRIARAAVTKLEASVGRRSNVILGLFVGAAAGGTTGYVLGKGLDHSSVCGSGCEWAVAAPFAAVGAVLGALVGAVTHTEHWKALPADRFRVGFAPWDRGMGLRASVSF